MVLSSIVLENGLVRWCLNNKFIVVVGIHSYSLYVWQQIFTVSETHYPGATLLPWYDLRINIPLLIVVTYISYNYFEVYFLKFKDQFKAVR